MMPLWLTTQHNSLDARLTTVFLHASWGMVDAARRELAQFHVELEAHLRDAERDLFAGLARLEDRERALARMEWKSHVRDLDRIVLAVDRELSAPAGAVLHESFGLLRRALRRHYREDERLVEIASALEPEPADNATREAAHS